MGSGRYLHVNCVRTLTLRSAQSSESVCTLRIQNVIAVAGSASVTSVSSRAEIWEDRPLLADWPGLQMPGRLWVPSSGSGRVGCGDQRESKGRSTKYSEFLPRD